MHPVVDLCCFEQANEQVCVEHRGQVYCTSHENVLADDSPGIRHRRQITLNGFVLQTSQALAVESDGPIALRSNIDMTRRNEFKSP